MTKPPGGKSSKGSEPVISAARGSKVLKIGEKTKNFLY
jgi:hypothetical protein